MRLILASASPRRKELLARFITDFEVIASDVDETINSESPPEQEIKRLARLKALCVAQKHTDALVIGADTMVLTDSGKLLSKPRDSEDALKMLLSLSGKKHEVITAVSIILQNMIDDSFSVSTDVFFTNISEEEAQNYIATGEPFDKAGAYAIQEKGAFFVERINGDYDNVVGLPAGALMRRLKELKLLENVFI